MSNEQIQVFVSYAHNDNVARTVVGDQGRPDAVRKKGFVDFLHEQLVLELLEQGYPNAKVWRDPRIGPAEPFGPMIRDEIAASCIFVAIMSRNWLASKYCQDELDLFLDRWKSDEPSAMQRRLVVVTKHHVDPTDWSPALQGQRGIKFYSLDHLNGSSPEVEYFARGDVQDDRYWQELKGLARALGLRAEEFGGRSDPLSRRHKPKTLLTEPPSNGRTVYVAKPANDMRKAYDSVVKELQGRGYIVVPSPVADLPYDSVDSALAVVSKALDAAEISVHLLANSAGFLHDGSSDPIVKLQLRQAATKVAPFDDREDTRKGFHRVMWAPRVLENDTGSTEGASKRDPFVVLETFDRQMASDCIEGGTLGDFIDFLTQHLVRETPVRKTLEKIEGHSKVYIYHPPEDTEYAFCLAKALRQRNIEPLLPAFDDLPSAQTQLHRQYLRDCDSVVLCWATGSETWAKVNSHALLDWQDLGRTKVFARRGLVAGPPPSTRKRMFVELYPKNEIDVVVDLTARPELSPEDLNPLFDGN